ncbi:MAG: hypothetical protein SFV21_20145 [Rhodospirillaceae bacterium]|nr:hypothetical protein [Rhodospirillaceae bacterium]
MSELSRRTTLAAALGVLAASPSEAQMPKTTRDDFNAWIAMRGGDDGQPAYWYSDGLVRPIKDGGKVASRMVGVETWVTPKAFRSATSAVSLSRKIFFFMDPARDDMATNPTSGKPERPSIFAYQVRTFTLVDGRIDYAVESHDLRAIRTGGAGVTYTVNRIADQVHVNYASFPVRPGPGGPVATSGEVYDYFDNGPRISELPARYQMSWVGTNLEGRIANQHGWRYATFDDIPNTWLKAIIRDKAPLWTAPPTTMAEIDKLRAQVPYQVPGLPV